MSDKIDYLKNCGTFEHYISLGHCCFVGIELEQLGLRDTSMPFDWVRTRWKAIEYSFLNNFKNYLDYDSLYQKRNALHVYKNLAYGVGFVHDFVDYKPLKSQIKNVQEKYDRRIKRFFYNITEPTLFVRYMWDYDELIYVASHYTEIEQMIKKYNAANEIVFISHDIPKDIDLSTIKLLFFIDKDVNCELNEKPISSNAELYSFLSTVEYKKREANFEFNKNKKIKKQENLKTFSGRIKRKFEKLEKSYSKKYIHDKQC